MNGGEDIERGKEEKTQGERKGVEDDEIKEGWRGRKEGRMEERKE